MLLARTNRPTNTEHLTVRRMGVQDLGFVIEQHKAHFPDNVFHRLGRRMLQCYYRTFLDSNHAVALVALIDGRPSGYLTGVLDTVKHRRLVKQFHAPSLAVASLLAALRHPLLAAGLVRRRIQIRRRPASKQPVAPTVTAVLSHVAVQTSTQRWGSGSALVDAFLHHCRDNQSREVWVATADNPEPAERLYLRRGFILTGRERTFDGRWIRLYKLELDTSERVVSQSETGRNHDEAGATS